MTNPDSVLRAEHIRRRVRDNLDRYALIQQASDPKATPVQTKSATELHGESATPGTAPFPWFKRLAGIAHNGLRSRRRRIG